MNIDKWHVLSLLQPEFKKTLQSVFVFGTLGSEVLMITKDNEVYGIGLNSHSCLGIYPPSSSYLNEPVRIDGLCTWGIRQFSAGSGPHGVALTTSGEIMTFGNNQYGELGTTTKLCVGVYHVGDVRFVQVACGGHHTLAITDKGGVFAWGKNNNNQSDCYNRYNGNNCSVMKPIIGGHKNSYIQDVIKMVACGYDTSFALSRNGKIYAWGNSENGKLGKADLNSAQPYVVAGLQGNVVTKIACGHSHTLVLCDNGRVFGWGCNNLGQLGNGMKFSGGTKEPIETCQGIGRIVDIAAIHYSHISGARTLDGSIYMWGDCGGHTVTSPTVTPFKDISDVFACYSRPPVTPQMLRVTPKDETFIVDSLKKVFDSEEHSDFKIIVENKPIYTHKFVLKIRSEHFCRMLGPNWGEGNSCEMTLDKFSYKAYRAFLFYLYSGEVEVEPDFAAELLELSNMYLEEELKKKCASIIESIITIENAADLYSSAILHHCDELENTCFNFFLAHSNAVVLTDGFNGLDPVILKSLVRKAASHGAFKY